MYDLLFENPLWLYVALAAAELVLGIRWVRVRTRGAAVALAVPAALALAVMTADMLVVTDREKIQAAMKEIAVRLDHRDVAGVGQYLADDFGGHYVTKDGALRAAQEALKTYNVRNIRASHGEVEMLDTQAKVIVRTTFDFDSEFGKGSYTLKWRLLWAKRDGQWLIINAEPPQEAQGL